MKFNQIFFSVLVCLVGCETTNVYPTKVVEVQTVKSDAPAPVVVTKIEYVNTLDCKSIDPSFEQQGDTCVSICVACLKGGGQCLDTNANGYGDTCVTLLPTPPENEPPPVPFCMDNDDDGFVECVAGCQLSANKQCGDCDNFDELVHPGADELCDTIDNNCDGATDTSVGMENAECIANGKCNAAHKDKVGQACSGNFGVCAVNGILACTNGGDFPVCSTEIGGMESKAVPEVCGDSLDNDCDGVTDNGCVQKIDPSEEDKDADGYKALVDCDDNDANLHPGLDACPTIKGLTKDSKKLVLVEGGPLGAPWTSYAYFKFGMSADDLQFSAKGFDKTWTMESFSMSSFAVTDLEDKPYVAFNVYAYPGYWYVCGGTVVDEIQLSLSGKLPKMYIVSGGVWKKASNKPEMLVANGLEVIKGPLYGGDYNKNKPAYCVALLKL